MSKEKPVFTQLSVDEVKINYRGMKFLLIEGDRGFYGAGRAIHLYKLEDNLDKKLMVEVGWTQTDNSHSPSGLINHFTNWDECKIASIKYIDNLLS